jgi:hypothetical protein
LSRHRFPSGATRPEARPGTLPPVPPVGHRLPALPAPPPVVSRTRVTVAAAAGGALVAAGQTVAGALGVPGWGGEAAVEESYARLAASAMLPVSSDTRPADTTAPMDTSAIGGEQLSAQAASLPDLDSTSKVDVANLTKAARMGREAAQLERAVTTAMSHGAPKAVMYNGEALVMPTAGRFTSGFGARWGVQHKGIDIAAPIGTPIFVPDRRRRGEAPAPPAGSGCGWCSSTPTAPAPSTATSTARWSCRSASRWQGGRARSPRSATAASPPARTCTSRSWEPDGTKINPKPWLAARGLDVTAATGSRDA